MSKERMWYGEQPQPDPDAIPALALAGDVAQVQETIRAKYGFEPTVKYCQDLIAFVEATARDSVQVTILDEYGFVPTSAYCRDLMAFVEDMGREVAL